MNEIDPAYQRVFDQLLELLAVIQQTQDHHKRPIWNFPPDVDEFMEWVYTLGLALHRQPDLRQTAAFQQYLQASAAHLQTMENDAWIYAFTHVVDRELFAFDSDLGDHYLWYGLPWRFSAIKFFIGLYQDFSPHHSTLFSEELIDIGDEDIAGVHKVMGGFKDEEIPEGIPFEHWWWWEEGQAINRSVRRPYVKPAEKSYYSPVNPDHLAP